MNKTVFFLLLLLIITGCQQVLPTQSILAIPSGTISVSPMVKPVTTITDSMHMTVVASIAPPQSTLTPFPTLDFVPRGKIIYMDSNGHVLHIIDGNGNNIISTVVESGDQSTWLPNGKSIVMTCSSIKGNMSISQLCFYDMDYLGISDISAHVVKIDISQTTQTSGFISSYSTFTF